MSLPTTFSRRPHRLSDAGFTLVEMVVALLIVAIASIAAAGVFVAAAAAQKTERSHSQAVRIATGILDELRGEDLCSLTMGTSTVPNGTYQGVAFSSETTLQAVKSSDPTEPLPLCSSTDSVVKASTVVSWTDRGVVAEVAMSTILGNSDDQVVAGNTGPTPSPTPSPSNSGPFIGTPIFSPSPVTINTTTMPAGRPATDVDVTVSATGFPAGTPLTGSYTDDEGPKSFILTSTDGVMWQGTISKSSLNRVITEQVSLIVTIEGATGQPNAAQLQLIPESGIAVPLTIVSASVNGTADIALNKVSGKSQNGGENRDSITLEANVTGLDPADVRNYVKVSYPLRTGGSGEVILSMGPDGKWRASIPAGSQKIAPGVAPDQTKFTFTVYRASDMVSETLVVPKNVSVP